MKWKEVALSETRRGLFLKGEKGLWGEATPLEGFSREAFGDVLKAASHPFSYPSLAFGYESAHLSPLDEPLDPWPINALFQDGCISSTECTTVKVKLGKLNVKEAIARVKPLLNRYRVRCDFNRMWSLGQAMEFAQAFPPETFDYLEEPAPNFSALAQYAALTHHPLALDETFREENLKSCLTLPRLKAIIYKPTLSGGLSLCQKLWEKIAPLGLELILSHSYESGIGMMHIAEMAHRLNLPKVPMGLDAHTPPKKDLLPLHLEKGLFYFQPNRWDNVKL